MSDNVNDTARRFEIFVPSPKARINLGASNTTSTGPFGYTGVSIQSDAHLFIDANKNTLFQTGGTYCGQVGGQWRQFSNDPMFVSSTSSTSITADTQLIIASGAGQGQITALDHGTNMRLVPYNGLKLHYVVDGLQASMLEFFNGRHKRHDAKFRGLFAPVKFEHFFTKKNWLVSLTAKAAKPLNEDRAGLEGGFIETVSRSWLQMEHGVLEAEVGDAAIFPANVPALGPILDAGIAKDSSTVLKDFEYGYSSYLKNYDPYKYGKANWWFAKLTKAIKILTRFVHVALKYGELITNLPLISQAIKAGEAANLVVKAAWSGYNMYRDSYPALIMLKRTSDGGFEFGGGAADEFNSGMKARIPTDPGGFEDSRQAKVESNAEPTGGWSLTLGTVYDFNVRWADGSKVPAVRVSPSVPAPATMSITAPALSNTPETKTLSLQIGPTLVSVALTSANTNDAQLFVDAITPALAGTLATATVAGGKAKIAIATPAEVALDAGAAGPTLDLPLPAPPAAPPAAPPPAPAHYTATLTINGDAVALAIAPVDFADVALFHTAVNAAVGGRAVVAINDTNDGLTITPPTPLVSLVDTTDNRSLLVRMSVGADTLTNDTQALTFGLPKLNANGEIEKLIFTVDGYRFVIDLDSTTNLQTQLAAEAALPTIATVAPASINQVALTTKTKTAASQIKVVSVFDDTRWSITPSLDEVGADACSNPLPLDELVGLIGSLEGVSVSKQDDKLVLEAKAKGLGSTVTASGSLRTLTFASSASATDTIAGAPSVGQVASDVESAFKTLKGWNHELQKLPEDARNLTRPLTNALTDTLSLVSAVEKTLKKVTEIVNDFRGKASPPPPESIGLLANDGITLATQDRIVGSGGKGVVFICDGGTGSPDRAKFVLTEGWVADIMQWSGEFWNRPSNEKKAKRSLGFRVLSDSHIDLTSTVTATLAALGRGEAAKARSDDRKAAVGIGIARVLGSYAAEVAGYEKVVVSARNPGKDGDEDGATGGRVELLAQRVIVGAANTDHNLGNGVKLALTDWANLGTEAFELKGLAGAEHLEDGEDSDVDYLGFPTKGHAWSAGLRSKHPDTTHIDIHATTQIDQAVLPFRVSLTPDAAKLGIVTPVEADRRKELEDAKDRLEGIKDGIEARKDKVTAAKLKITARKTRAKAKRDMVIGLPQWDSHAEMVEICEIHLDLLKDRLTQLTEELEKATEDFDEAKDAHTNFSNDWDTKAFPLLEVEEESIKLGFVAGSGEWEDFAYLEITKDGIKLFQPKSKGIATIDTKSKLGVISDGSKDASLTAKSGKITIKFNDCKAGPLKMDSSGNVKIG